MLTCVAGVARQGPLDKKVSRSRDNGTYHSKPSATSARSRLAGACPTRPGFRWSLSHGESWVQCSVCVRERPARRFRRALRQRASVPSLRGISRAGEAGSCARCSARSCGETCHGLGRTSSCQWGQLGAVVSTRMHPSTQTHPRSNRHCCDYAQSLRSYSRF
jgi:hypothetical protein